MKYLLNNTGLKVSKCDKKGNNCLHLTGYGLNISCIRYLLKKLKNPDILFHYNEDGKTPYDILE